MFSNLGAKATSQKIILYITFEADFEDWWEGNPQKPRFGDGIRFGFAFTATFRCVQTKYCTTATLYILKL